MRVLMLGDSHLARVSAAEARRMADDVVNRAFGGALASELVDQLGDLDPTSFDAVVVSIGTNDGGPWRAVPREVFVHDVEQLVERSPDARWVFVRSPGCDDRYSGDRLDHVLSEYADLAEAVFLGAGGLVVDTLAALSELGAAAFMGDGVHLTDVAHGLMLARIEEVLSTLGDS
jgi:lysophospholipase L1-like esterase